MSFQWPGVLLPQCRSRRPGPHWLCGPGRLQGSCSWDGAPAALGLWRATACLPQARWAPGWPCGGPPAPRVRRQLPAPWGDPTLSFAHSLRSDCADRLLPTQPVKASRGVAALPGQPRDRLHGLLWEHIHVFRKWLWLPPTFFLPREHRDQNILCSVRVHVWESVWGHSQTWGVGPVLKVWQEFTLSLVKLSRPEIDYLCARESGFCTGKAHSSWTATCLLDILLLTK